MVGFIDVPTTQKVTFTSVRQYPEGDGYFEQDNPLNLCPDCSKSFMFWVRDIEDKGKF